MKNIVAILAAVLVFSFARGAFGEQAARVPLEQGSLMGQARLLFSQGNAYYTEEKFAQAIADYEAVLSLGYESGPLYYNLGNAYFKAGHLGKAILNYLRATRLLPRDADLVANLDYARSLIKGGQVRPERGWFARLFLVFTESFSLNEVTLICVALYLILALFTILTILITKLRKALFYFDLGVLAIWLIFLAVFFVQYQTILLQQQAVVITEASDSKFEPNANATTFFSLNEGEAVTVTGAKEDWVKVRRIDGRQGWLKKTDLELL